MNPEAGEIVVVIINLLFGKQKPDFAFSVFVLLVAGVMCSMILFAEGAQDAVFPLIVLGFLFMRGVFSRIRKMRNESIIDQQDGES